MRAYWTLWWRAAFLYLTARYLRRAWERNPHRREGV